MNALALRLSLGGLKLGGGTGGDDFLLLEDGTALLLEDGTEFLLE